MNRSLLIACLFCATAVPAGVQAREVTPFSIKNQNPFILIYGLPATEPARLKGANESASALALDMANNSIIGEPGSERISLDGETYRLALTLRHGLSDATEIGIELPFVAHSNGFMDNFIEDWHDTFGLTNSQRNKSTSNSLDYHYERDGTRLMGFDQPNQGIGDIRLFAARQLDRDVDSALALHASLKLPSGDTQTLHGSGAADLSFSLAHLKQGWLSPLRLTTSFNAGLLLLGQGDVLAQQQKDAVIFGSAGLIWDSGSLIDLKAQLDVHSRFYDSQLAQLGSDTIQLTVGGSLHFNPTTRLDIGVGENLLTDTTPDFLINLVLKNAY